LLALRNARGILSITWPVLKEEPDLAAEFSDHAAALTDMLARETFHKEIAAIGQHAAALKAEHARRHAGASARRSEVYTAALAKVATVPGWTELEEGQRERLAAPLSACAAPAAPAVGLALLRSDTDACPGRTQKVIEEMLRLAEGTRLVRLDIATYFSGGIETTEQLDAAINALREECERQLAEGKRILIQ